MNRAERRRAEREKQKGYSPVDPAIRDAVTQAIIDRKNRDDAAMLATGPLLESVYAAAIIILSEEYGFDHDQCYHFLEKLEDKTLYCIEHQDILDEAFEKVGIRIHFQRAIDRIEEVSA